MFFDKVVFRCPNGTCAFRFHWTVTRDYKRIVGQFSKWLGCIPLPAQTAEQTARAKINEFFSRFGCPFQIFTDQGRNFESRLIKSICDVLQINKEMTTRTDRRPMVKLSVVTGH